MSKKTKGIDIGRFEEELSKEEVERDDRLMHIYNFLVTVQAMEMDHVIENQQLSQSLQNFLSELRALAQNQNLEAGQRPLAIDNTISLTCSQVRKLTELELFSEIKEDTKSLMEDGSATSKVDIPSSSRKKGGRKRVA